MVASRDFDLIFLGKCKWCFYDTLKLLQIGLVYGSAKNRSWQFLVERKIKAEHEELTLEGTHSCQELTPLVIVPMVMTIWVPQ